MQSLILATSLIISSQAPITSVDTADEIDAFVSAEAQRVSNRVDYHVRVAAQDTFLYQAKLVISQAKKDRATKSLNHDTAE